MGERKAVVVGAGLAGAAITSVLCRRGWSVALLDAASGPAQGASSLPVGMLSPHLTRAPTALSRLSEMGVAATRAELQRLVPPGAGWQAVEVDNLDHAAGRHPAALVRPGALIAAWLDEAAATRRLSSQWNAPIARLRLVDGQWHVLAADGSNFAQGCAVVVAAALGSLQVLGGTDGEWPLHPVQGQMSLGPALAPMATERPKRKDGVFVPSYADEGLAPRWPSPMWSVGSTYARGVRSERVTDAAHALNAERLRQIDPLAADLLEPALADGRWQGWAGVRCASRDRLPLVGAAPDLTAWKAKWTQARVQRSRWALSDVPRLPGLYLLTALGSRGLSLATWCAAALAASMEQEPSPDRALTDAIDPARFAWRSARRQSGPA